MRVPIQAVLGVLAWAGTSVAWGQTFPPDFLWGTAIAGFQTEMGGASAHEDQGSDWWAWVHDPANIAAHRVSGDEPEDGPAFYDLYRQDLKMAARRLHANTIRLSVEWSRIFPTSTVGIDASTDLLGLDAVADQVEVAHYRAVLEQCRRQGLVPFVTLSHFSLPSWVHDPIATRDALTGANPLLPPPTGFGPAGWLDAGIVTEFAKLAAYVGWQYGDLVDLWAPLNEPLVVGVNGFVNVPGILSGNFPPGAFSFTGVLSVILHEAEAHAAAYDALKRWDTDDADGDGTAAQVGLVHNMVAFHPKTPGTDDTAAAHADYLFNRLYLNATILGDADANANGTIDPGEHRPDLAGRADFVGVNYYLRAVAQRSLPLGGPVIPLLDFLPTLSYQTPQSPTAPACPSECTEFGWEIYPQGLREVLAIAGSYGLPVYITENGIADNDDDQRPAYLVQHLAVLAQAIADGVADVRGYYHWSLVDNFEWSAGYYPRFGLFAFNSATKQRIRRPSARYFARIARKNAIPNVLLRRFGS